MSFDVDYVGYAATSCFILSYMFSKKPRVLLGIQFISALLWLTYGVLTHQKPVMVANVLVALASLTSLLIDLRQNPHNNISPSHG